jgi:hypothetical protein
MSSSRLPLRTLPAQATLGKKLCPVLVNPFTQKAYVLGHHIAVATRVIQPGAKFYY